MEETARIPRFIAASRHFSSRGAAREELQLLLRALPLELEAQVAAVQWFPRFRTSPALPVAAEPLMSRWAAIAVAWGLAALGAQGERALAVAVVLVWETLAAPELQVALARMVQFRLKSSRE
jgi:hypothetical protein